MYSHECFLKTYVHIACKDKLIKFWFNLDEERIIYLQKLPRAWLLPKLTDA